MLKLLLSKFKESIFSVLPITVLVLFLHFTLCPLDTWLLIMFLIGSLMLVVGMALFNLGADLSLLRVGEQVGGYITRKRSLWILLIIGFLIGVIITIAEPDLLVLAAQFSINNYVLILSVAIGVGIFLMIALLRIILQINLNYLLIGFYLIIFVIAFIVSQSKPEFLVVAFDSGGVTTGPMTVPLILSLGLGVASARGGKHSNDDSFGLVSMCSIGPIISVLVLGLIFETNKDVEVTKTIITNFSEFSRYFLHVLEEKTLEIAIAMIGIIAFIIIFQCFILKSKFKIILKTLLGLLYVFVGLVIFLAGANVGFMQVGTVIGQTIISKSYGIIMIPLGMLIGFFVVMAEPSVHVLNKQVEEITAGSISRKAMLFTLAIGVSISIGLAMARVIVNFNILYILVPGYLIALVLSFFTPKIFTAIAFDSGGVASGPMTATFLLPMASGVAYVLYAENDINAYLVNSFGVVALVAMTPLIVIQIMGLIYTIKVKIAKRSEIRVPEEVIEFPISFLTNCEVK